MPSLFDELKSFVQTHRVGNRLFYFAEVAQVERAARKRKKRYDSSLDARETDNFHPSAHPFLSLRPTHGIPVLYLGENDLVCGKNGVSYVPKEENNDLLDYESESGQER